MPWTKIDFYWLSDIKKYSFSLNNFWTIYKQKYKKKTPCKCNSLINNFATPWLSLNCALNFYVFAVSLSVSLMTMMSLTVWSNNQRCLQKNVNSRIKTSSKGSLLSSFTRTVGSRRPLSRETAKMRRCQKSNGSWKTSSIKNISEFHSH